MRAGTALDNFHLDGDQEVGVNIVRQILSTPSRLIAENAGLEGSVVVAKIQGGQGAFGLNAGTGEYEDLLQVGIVDPTKVVRSALQNASSVAGLLLTTETLVTEVEEKPKPEAHGHGHHHHH